MLSVLNLSPSLTLCTLFVSKNIFLGEDIRKQLPRESAEFDDVNANWKVQILQQDVVFCLFFCLKYL